jgi:II/X family phage/plasmid replication protein
MKIPVKRSHIARIFARPRSGSAGDPSPFKWKQIRSELSGTTCRAFAATSGTEIDVELSLPKWVQGHNLFGINQISRLCAEVAAEVCKALGITLTTADLERLNRHNYHVSRVDTTGSFDVGSQANVMAVMAEIRLQLLAQGNKIVVHEGPCGGIETIYVGKSKRGATMKFYNKYLELQAHPLPLDLPNRAQILAKAKALIRFEIMSRSQPLAEKGLKRSDDWSINQVRKLLLDRFSQFKFTGKIKARLDAEEIEGLKPRLKMIYGLWRDGADMQKHVAPHSYRRYRKELLLFSIDIGRSPASGGATLCLEDLLAPERMIITWPKHLGRIGAIYGAKGWKESAKRRRG